MRACLEVATRAQLVHVMPTSEWVLLFYTFVDYYHQLMLRRESTTGKRSSCQVRAVTVPTITAHT